MEDICAVGFKRFSFAEKRSAVRRAPKELRALLDRHTLTFAVPRAGTVSIRRASRNAGLHLQHARFVRLGASIFRSSTNGRRACGRRRRYGAWPAADRESASGRQTWRAARSSPYMNSTARTAEVRRCSTCRSRHLRLLFDVAHYSRGRRSVAAFRVWTGSTSCNLKDVRPVGQVVGWYEFVSLARSVAFRA